jgi:surface antigen/Ni/Co efflux regulator RcnB
MMKKTAMALVAAATMASQMAMPTMADAQYYGAQTRQDRGGPPDRGGPSDRGRSDQYREGFQDGYKSGYRAGNDASKNRQRYDDTDYSYGYGYDNPARGYFNNGPSYNNGPGPNVSNDDRGRRWQARYSRTYTYNDDSFYQDCRQSVDPAGVIAGALIGGLLGNSVARGGSKGGATVAGVIAGGAIGAALTKNMDCNDRSYAYKTYSQGFNAGRPNVAYDWRNPDNGHYGNFRVGDTMIRTASTARITRSRSSSRAARRPRAAAPASSRMAPGQSSAKTTFANTNALPRRHASGALLCGEGTE